MVRLFLARLKALTGEWEALRPLVADCTAPARLVLLHARLEPRLRMAVNGTQSPQQLRIAIREPNHSINRLNTRWAGFLLAVELAPVNASIAGYNRYYVLATEYPLLPALSLTP